MWVDDIVPRDTDPVSRSGRGYAVSGFTEKSLVLVSLVSDSTRKLAYILNKYLLGMEKYILYVFDILNAEIYNRVGRERKDGRSKRYVREHLSKPVGCRL